MVLLEPLPIHFAFLFLFLKKKYYFLLCSAAVSVLGKFCFLRHQEAARVLNEGPDYLTSGDISIRARISQTA